MKLSAVLPGWPWRRASRASDGALPVRDRVDIGPSRPVHLSAFDQPLVTVVGVLVLLGVVMVYSASVALPDNPKFAAYTQTFFLQRHLLALAIAAVAALLAVQVPMSVWEKHAPWIFVVTLILLVLVLMPFIGKVVNQSRRWIPLGFMNFQPSELAKLAIALYAANYMVRRMDTREKFFRAVSPMVVAVAFVGLLLLRQPDMGAFIVIATIAMGHPVPGRRQRAHVLPHRAGADRGAGRDAGLRRPAPRAHPGLPGSLESENMRRARATSSRTR